MSRQGSVFPYSCSRTDDAVHTFLEQSVADNMTRDVKSVSPLVTVRELGELFEKDDFNAYPVAENAHVVGLVSKFDFLACFIFTPAHMIPRYEELMKQTVADIMTPDFIYVGIETRLTRVLQLMVEHRIRSMPVLADEHRLAGMIARGDVMLALQNSGREAAESMAGQRGIRLDD
jgi:CBS domain-containing protein